MKCLSEYLTSEFVRLAYRVRQPAELGNSSGRTFNLSSDRRRRFARAQSQGRRELQLPQSFAFPAGLETRALGTWSIAV
jgi:hypothetical protein